MAVDVLVLGGLGINCEEETKYAFELAGAKAEIVHVNDLIEGLKKLSDYQILAFPGGFSYGDDTGAGNALASRLKNNLQDELLDFAEGDNLAIGICNGFQVMTNLGLLPALDGEYGTPSVALTHNTSARYICRWIDLQFQGNSPWTKDLSRMSIPIAHAEGNFYTDKRTLAKLNEKGLVAARYVEGEICHYQRLEANPNGSLENIASITDESGRLIGMMPHPERAISFTNRPDWTFLKEHFKRGGKPLPENGYGLKIFQNAVEYFE